MRAKIPKIKARSLMDPCHSKREKLSPGARDRIPIIKKTWFIFTSRGITHKRLLKKFRRNDHGLLGWK